MTEQDTKEEWPRDFDLNFDDPHGDLDDSKFNDSETESNLK